MVSSARSISPNLMDNLRTEAFRLGFIFMGITLPARPVHYQTYETWLRNGRHAGMAYLATERALQARRSPERIFPGAVSILSLAFPYPRPPAEPGPEYGRVAAYALLPDYHDFIPPRLESLRRRMEIIIGQDLTGRPYTDTGPILERDLAMAAGLGWIGKNTCLIHPSFGSYFFLAELFTTATLPVTPPFNQDRCGACRRCMDACPTGCILPDRTIDARRCISYLTIEHKGPIPPDLRSPMGNWIFGCDICQLACPWNRFQASHTGTRVVQPPAAPVPLADELRLGTHAFNQKFKNSPIQRPHRRGYLRNIAVALGNSGDSGAIRILGESLLYEAEPLVRSHCAWALGRYQEPAARSLLDQARKLEIDPSVCAEIQAALEGQGIQAGKAASATRE